MFELTLPPEAIADCSHSGACDADCEHWEALLPELRRLDSAEIRACLAEYGAWDVEELQDDYQNRIRLLWLAAGSCSDEGTEYFVSG